MRRLSLFWSSACCLSARDGLRCARLKLDTVRGTLSMKDEEDYQVRLFSTLVSEPGLMLCSARHGILARRRILGCGGHTRRTWRNPAFAIATRYSAPLLHNTANGIHFPGTETHVYPTR